MTNDNNLLKQRKESLLSELESIKYILGEANTTDIPILDDIIIEETDTKPQPHKSPPPISTITETEAPASSLETTSPTGALPNQQSLFNESLKSTDASAQINNTMASSPSFKTESRMTTPHFTGSHSSLAQNPFLPPHVRKRFQESSLNTTPSHDAKVTPHPPQGSTVKTSYTEQLVDQLIAHHLPKIEAELRQKLLAVVNTHNERVKK